MKRLDLEQRGSLADDKVRGAITYFAERVAHDLNNIITPLLAYPDILIPSMPNEKSVTIVRGIQESAQRAHDVMQLLAALAGGGMQEAEMFDMSDMVVRALQAAKDQLGHTGGDITVEEDVASGLLIKMEREAFVRAFEAVLENAIVALIHKESEGKISVKAQTVCTDAPQAGVGGKSIPAGTYHVLSVSDTGIGISDEDISQIVEPFVSKFPEKRGCGGGLGLSVAYCGLRRNGGHMQISSTAGEGTEVKLYFSPADQPAGVAVPEEAPSTADNQQAAAPSVVTAEKEAADASEVDPSAKRILVVDDEASIAELFKMILENFIPGIVVDRAANGSEALEQFKRTEYPVVVMDLHMPVMDGQVSFFKIKQYCREHDRKMPAVVFCSGYAPQATLRQEVEQEPSHALLNKPVQSDILVDAVRERLISGSAA